jgi:hypothetical protein
LRERNFLVFLSLEKIDIRGHDYFERQYQIGLC